MLRNPYSKRVTYAAVFIPADKTQAVEYVLPEDIRLASGFVHYNHDRHHKSKGLGILCCGNCYAEERVVEVSHRGPTKKRTGGGDLPGRHSTFTAYSNTIDEHGEYCRERRANLEEERTLKTGVTFNINIEDTYSGERAPRRLHKARKDKKIELKDARLEDRRAIAINDDIAEILKAGGRLSRETAQSAMYVIDGRARTHGEMFIDGDGWKNLVADSMRMKIRNRRAFIHPPRIFHVINPRSQNLRQFNAVAEAGEEKEVKISCRQYEFKDRSGRLHIFQPSIVTASRDVKAVFEELGDYLVMGRFKHIPGKTRTGGGAVIHQIQIMVGSAELAVELYNTPKRRIKDYNAMHNLQVPFDSVSMINPRMKSKPAPKPILRENVPDLFAAFTA